MKKKKNLRQLFLKSVSRLNGKHYSQHLHKKQQQQQQQLFSVSLSPGSNWANFCARATVAPGSDERKVISKYLALTPSLLPRAT